MKRIMQCMGVFLLAMFLLVQAPLTTFGTEGDTAPAEEAKVGKVHVNYVDISGFSIFEEYNYTLEGDIGKPYVAINKVDMDTQFSNGYMWGPAMIKDDFHLIGAGAVSGVIGNKVGTFSESDQTVTFVFNGQGDGQTNKESYVEVRFVNENNQEIWPRTLHTIVNGGEYKTRPAEINGYTLVGNSGSPAEGQVAAGQSLQVTYKYKLNTPPEGQGVVVVRYMRIMSDINTSYIPAIPSEVITGDIGMSYREGV